MNVRLLLLAGSLAANCALLAALAWGLRTPPSTPAARSPAPPPLAAAAPAIGSELWARLEPGTLPTLAARLRAEGFPPALVGAIVAAEVHEQFAPRREALASSSEADKPYWRASPFFFIPSAELQALYAEQQAVVRSLLRPEEDAYRLREIKALHRQFPQLAVGKIAALLEINEEFDRRENALRPPGEIFGVDLPGVAQQRLALQGERRQQLARLLTAGELNDYELRTSLTAENLRENLSAFNPTEEEFRTLFRLQHEFDRAFGGDWTHLSAQEQRARNTAAANLADSIRVALGEARFADYERSSDYDFRQTSELVSRLGQAPETAKRVWEMQADLTRRRDEIQRQALVGDQRGPQLAALAEEARTQLVAALGERGYEIYRQNICGSWLTDLTP